MAKRETTKDTVDRLWEYLRDQIDEAHKAKTLPTDCPREAVRNQGWTDYLLELKAHESDDEHGHRRFKPSCVPPYRGFSVDTAARLLVINKIGEGAASTLGPDGANGYKRAKVTDILHFRTNAVRCLVLGEVLAPILSEAWVAEACALDYAEAASAAQGL